MNDEDKKVVQRCTESIPAYIVDNATRNKDDFEFALLVAYRTGQVDQINEALKKLVRQGERLREIGDER